MASKNKGPVSPWWKVSPSLLLIALLALFLLDVTAFPWRPQSIGSLGLPTPGPDEPLEQSDFKALTAFEDVTADSGVIFIYRNGQEADLYTILETVGGGVALLDYDGDGLLDIFLPGGGYFEGKEIRGYPCRLYKNLGNFRFKDVTKEAGLDKPLFYTHGCAVADFNRDGWPDLLVTGWGRVVLYQNVPDGKGGRKFVDVTKKARLTDKLWSVGAAWADFDGDGFPDLYITQYLNWSIDNNPECWGGGGPGGIQRRRDICPPKMFQGLPHRLYRNNRDGTFTDVSKQAGLNGHGVKTTRQSKPFEPGKGQGVVAADFNNDGRPDIYVANDTVDNFLYLNKTKRSRIKPSLIKLSEEAMKKGVAQNHAGKPNGSHGVAVADFGREGFAGIFVTAYEGELHSLYQNKDNRYFRYLSEASGLGVIGQRNVGFGTAFLDLDNDGFEDLVLVNGHVIRHPRSGPVKQPPHLFWNQDGRQFRVVQPRDDNYFLEKHRGRGLAVGDLDNDGRPDLVISNINESVAVLRNVVRNKGERNHWLGIELAAKGHRDVVGSRIVVEIKGRKLTRFATGGGSYLSASDSRHLFGLAKDSRVDRVTVHWSWGGKQTWDGKQFPADRYWLLVEGDKKARPWTGRNQRDR
jgi:hypothetical protein